MTSDADVEPDPSDEAGDDAELPPVPWPAIALGVISLLVAVLSFTSFYRYTPGPIFRRVCASATCPDTLATANAWTGGFGWLPVVIALLAAAVVIASAAMPERAVALTAGAVVLYAAAAGTELAGLGDVPDYARGVQTSRALRVSYAESVSEGHGWGYWVSLGLLVVAVALGAVQLTAAFRARAEQAPDPAGH